jgi:hypothetical protein
MELNFDICNENPQLTPWAKVSEVESVSWWRNFLSSSGNRRSGSQEAAFGTYPELGKSIITLISYLISNLILPFQLRVGFQICLLFKCPKIRFIVHKRLTRDASSSSRPLCLSDQLWHFATFWPRPDGIMPDWDLRFSRRWKCRCWVFWVTTPCKFVGIHQRLGETYWSLPWRWRQYFPPKRWYLPWRPHGITTQNSNIETDCW